MKLQLKTTTKFTSDDVHVGTILFHKRSMQFGMVMFRAGRYVNVQLMDGNRVNMEDCIVDFKMCIPFK